jgi:hypothetical protein
MRHLLLSGSVHEAQTEEGRLKEDLRRQKIPLVQLQSVSTVKIPLVQLQSVSSVKIPLVQLQSVGTVCSTYLHFR